MEKMRRVKKSYHEDTEKHSPESSLSDDNLMDFQRYMKIKTAIIIWNISAASVCFFIFFVSMWRVLTGNRRPWLFKYVFPNDNIYDAVHSVEVSYFPKSLTYVDMIYVVAPIYATILYASTASTIAVSVSLKNYHYLRATKSLFAVMTVPCILLVSILGKFFKNFKI